MAERITQSLTKRVSFEAYLSSDHVTPATGKTIAITISKNGAAFGNPSAGATNATEIAVGSYYVDLSTTDTGTAGPLIVYGTVAGVDAVKVHFSVTDGLVTLAAVTHTGAVIPTVTAVGTLTTYTGNTPQTGDGYARIGTAGAGLTALGDTRIANLDATISSRTKPADTQARVTLVDTVTTYTGNTPQTGDGYARIGAAGAGLTALGDTRIANLDATVSSRLAPAGTLATVTNLANAPTSGDFTATMKTSVQTAASAATPSVTVSDKTGFSLAVTPPTASDAATAVWAAAARTLTAFGFTVAPSANENADALLGRNLAGGSNGGRTVQDALRVIRNKVTLVPIDVHSGTLTVYQEDDTTPAWSGVVALDSTALPITAVDPA